MKTLTGTTSPRIEQVAVADPPKRRAYVRLKTFRRLEALVADARTRLISVEDTVGGLTAKCASMESELEKLKSYNNRSPEF